jgi:hypothetical protein
MVWNLATAKQKYWNHTTTYGCFNQQLPNTFKILDTDYLF